DAFFVVGIFREQQEFEFALDCLLTLLKMLFLVMRHLLHLGVFGLDEHLVRACEILFNLLELAVLLDDFLELGVLLRDFLVARGVGGHFGSRKLLRQLVVAGAKLIQFFSKGQCSHGKSSSKRNTKIESEKSKIERI